MRLKATLRANAFAEINRQIVNIQCREKRKPSVWATEERILPPGSPLSARDSIPYRHAIMPHCVEPMDAVDDPAVNKIVLWFSIRDGKTLGVCCNIIGRTVTDDPSNIYSVHPTLDDAERFSVGDIEPMIEACLEDYFVAKKSREPGRTMSFKRFKGGWLRILSAGSITKFRGVAVKVLLLHELDALEPESIHKAFGRTTGFSDAIIVLESTGTLAPTVDAVTGEIIYNSRIHEAYEQGDKRKWFCECASCHHLQWLKYAQIKWPPGRMEKAAYHCEKCDFAHDEEAWRRMVSGGRWYPTAGLSAEEQDEIARNYTKARAKDRTVRSYWRNGFNSLLPVAKGFKTKLHEFVGKGEAAKTSIEALRVWTQEIAAELWNPELEGESSPAWRPLFDRREDYGLIVPEKALVVTAYVDCQLDRLEVGWRAWGRNEESWGLDHVVLDGHVRDPEVWQALRSELARKFQHTFGCDIQLSMAFVDGGAYAEDVYRFFQRLARDPMPGVNGHVRASKGVGQHGHPIVTRKLMTIAKNLRGHHIGTWEAKDRIYERLRMEPVENDTREGVVHFNHQFSEEYFQQLTAESVVVTYERGVEIRKYVNPAKVRNEALDLEVGCLAALRLHPRNLDAIEAGLKTRAATETISETPAPDEEVPKKKEKLFQPPKYPGEGDNRSPFGTGWNL